MGFMRCTLKNSEAFVSVQYWFLLLLHSTCNSKSFNSNLDHFGLEEAPLHVIYLLVHIHMRHPRAKDTAVTYTSSNPHERDHVCRDCIIYHAWIGNGRQQICVLELISEPDCRYMHWSHNSSTQRITPSNNNKNQNYIQCIVKLSCMCNHWCHKGALKIIAG